MELRKVEVKNFRSFVETTEFSVSEGMNALVGPNNCGKSNLMRALKMGLDSDYDFIATADIPGQRPLGTPRVTLTFQCEARTQKEKTLLNYLEAYERSVVPDVNWTYASKGVARLVVAYRGTQNTGFTRQEYFSARSGGDRRGNAELNDKALKQLRKTLQFVTVESGQNIENLLSGKFREILLGVLEFDMREQFSESERARNTYIEVLKKDVMGPLRQHMLPMLKRLFPELGDISLIPSVPSLDETMSNVQIRIRDSIETALRDKGTGVAGGVLIALLRYLTEAHRESFIFAIEEPEAFLHPAAQEDLRDDLESLAERKGVSLIVTTHSPYIISRAAKAQVIAIEKSRDGASRIADIASGEDDQARVISGLFRDEVIPRLLDRYASLPASAAALLLVEGTSDAEFLYLAAERLGFRNELKDLHIIPSCGAEALVTQAVLLKLEARQPVWVLVDSDEMGRHAKYMLLKRFKFDKSDVMEYRVFANGLEGAEAEWLFESSLMERFVDQFGQDIVLKSKAKHGGEFRYDFTPVGKVQFPKWLEDSARPKDLERWRPILECLRGKLAEAIGQ